MYDPLDSRAAAAEGGDGGHNLGFGSGLDQQQPPKTNQDAADAAGTGVVAALMEVCRAGEGVGGVGIFCKAAPEKGGAGWGGGKRAL